MCYMKISQTLISKANEAFEKQKTFFLFDLSSTHSALGSKLVA